MFYRGGACPRRLPPIPWFLEARDQLNIVATSPNSFIYNTK